MSFHNYVLGILPLALLLFSGCKTRSGQSELRELGGPVKIRNAWLQSPESIEGTITKTWGINMTTAERWRYIRSTYAFLGGTNVASFKGGIDQPNSLFILAISGLSDFVSKQMVQRQLDLEARSEPYLFEGLGLSEANKACFNDKSVAWCDALDEVRVNSLSSAGLKARDLDLEWRKRLMHNIQDIGEFMLIDTDNSLVIPDGSDRHAAQYLLEEVFLPHLGEGPITPELEKEAWRDVVYTILMGGGYFVGITPDDAQDPTVAAFNHGDKPIAIPDFSNNSPGILKLELKPQKTGVGIIRKIQLRAYISHPIRGQLRIDLTRGAKTVTVYQGATDPKRNFEDLELAFDSDSQESLKAFINQPAGPWIATIYDNKTLEKGTLDNLVLTVEYGN
jgi:subtilisin-like proprotein convertase family protein